MNKKTFEAIGIGVMSVAAIELMNRIINENSKKYKLKYDEGYYYTWKEGSIHYNVKGNGSPILLVHDLSVISSSYEWNKLEDKLAANHTVYTIDLLGCGLSDKPSITYTNYTFVQIISDFVNDIIKNKCDVISSNDSSSIVIMANAINKLFNKIILINPACFDIFAMETTRLDLLQKDVMYLPIVGTALYNYYTRESNIKTTLSSYFYDTSNISDTLEGYYESSHVNNSKGRFLYACKKSSYLTCDVRPALRNTKDLYILVGSESDTQIANEYRDINSSIDITTINKSNLLPHIENVEDTLQAINNIL